MEPEVPDFDSSFIEVKDVVFSHPTGTVVYEIPYLNGQELLRRVRITTASGYEMLMLIPSGSTISTTTLITPGDDFKFDVLSGNRVRTTNLNTGATVVVDADDYTDPGGLVWPAGPNTVWQQEFEDFFIAWQAETAVPQQSMIVTYLPQKYIDAGFITSGSGFGGALQCRTRNGIDECGDATGEALGAMALVGVGCIKFTILGCAILGTMTLYPAFKAQKEACDRCAAVRAAPPGASGGSSGGGAPGCPANVCSNFTGPAFPSLTCGCVTWFRPNQEADWECLEHGCW